MFLFRVPNLVGILIDYLANLENLVGNHLRNLKIFQGDLEIPFEFPCMRDFPLKFPNGTEQEVRKF